MSHPYTKGEMKNYNHQEPIGLTSDRLKFVLNNIRRVLTQNKIMAPFISNTYETDITQKYNSLHRKYVDITKICRHQNEMKTS